MRESIKKTITNCASIIIEKDMPAKRQFVVIRDHYENMLRGHYDEISLKDFTMAVLDEVRSFFA